MFLETICIEDGVVRNLEAHEKRVQRTAAHFGFTAPSLSRELENRMPEQPRKGRVKCRVIYRESIQEVTFERYYPKEIRSLRLIEASPDYSFKYANRTVLNNLLALKGDRDEILIVRHGLITDTSYSNVVLSKRGNLYTPAEPLLNGTKRQKLLQKGIIKEKRIHKDSLPAYDRLYLINAMLDIEDDVSLPTSKIAR